jgi:hypothetical protein
MGVPIFLFIHEGPARNYPENLRYSSAYND